MIFALLRLLDLGLEFIGFESYGFFHLGRDRFSMTGLVTASLASRS